MRAGSAAVIRVHSRAMRDVLLRPMTSLLRFDFNRAMAMQTADFILPIFSEGIDRNFDPTPFFPLTDFIKPLLLATSH